MAQAGSNYKKTEGPKFRWTVPLRKTRTQINEAHTMLTIVLHGVLIRSETMYTLNLLNLILFCNITPVKPVWVTGRAAGPCTQQILRQ